MKTNRKTHKTKHTEAVARSDAHTESEAIAKSAARPRQPCFVGTFGSFSTTHESTAHADGRFRAASPDSGFRPGAVDGTSGGFRPGGSMC